MDDRTICGLLSVVRKLHPDTPACLSYHPDADPGDGSGWCLEVGDWRTHGSLDEVATAWRKREGLEVVGLDSLWCDRCDTAEHIRFEPPAQPWCVECDQEVGTVRRNTE